jgi:hypothetical protein
VAFVYWKHFFIGNPKGHSFNGEQMPETVSNGMAGLFIIAMIS